MKAPLRNLHEWLRRVGVAHATEQLEYLNTVQPVEIVADASALTSPLLPPTAFAGGEHTNAGANFMAAQIHARAPGGIFLRAALIGATGNFVWRFGLLPAPAALVAPLTAAIHVMTPPPVQPIRSVVTFSEIAADPLGVTGPTYVAPNRASLTLVDEIYVPSGSAFLMLNNAAGIGLNYGFHFTWQEIPVE